MSQQNPAAGIFPGTERPDTPGQETGTAGTDRVFSVLAVCGELLRDKADMAESRGCQGNEPVMHKQVLCPAMLRNKAEQWTVHNQRAACDVVLHQQARE